MEQHKSQPLLTNVITSTNYIFFTTFSPSFASLFSLFFSLCSFSFLSLPPSSSLFFSLLFSLFLSFSLFSLFLFFLFLPLHLKLQRPLPSKTRVRQIAGTGHLFRFMLFRWVWIKNNVYITFRTLKPKQFQIDQSQGGTNQKTNQSLACPFCCSLRLWGPAQTKILTQSPKPTSKAQNPLPCCSRGCTEKQKISTCPMTTPDNKNSCDNKTKVAALFSDAFKTEVLDCHENSQKKEDPVNKAQSHLPWLNIIFRLVIIMSPIWTILTIHSKLITLG